MTRIAAVTRIDSRNESRQGYRVSSQQVSVLEVHDLASGEVAPTSAFVHLVLTGDRLFSGRAAFEKAEELRRLATSLAGAGVPQTALALEGASLDVSSGVFTKSSSVTYRVRVLVEDLDKLGSVLDAVAEAKKASLTELTWNYDSNVEAEHALLRKAGERAAAKARVLAAAVGAQLGAIHSVREAREEHGTQRHEVLLGMGPARARAGSVAQEFAGLELAPKKKVTVRVTIAYAVSSSA
jgi:uncharacterized protein YggE